MIPPRHNLFPPRVYVGEFHGWKHFWLEVMGWGRMFCQHPPKPAYHGEPWAFDNGVFSAWDNGEPWDESDYLRRLERAYSVCLNRPDFAVLPDLPTKGLESLDFSISWLESSRIPHDWRWYLAVQDGMTVEHVRPLLHRIGGILLGGSDRFKATAAEWSDLAHQWAIPFHYARCGNVAKLQLAFDAKADSVDSTGIIRNERRDNSFWRFAMEWKHPQRRAEWKQCRDMLDGEHGRVVTDLARPKPRTSKRQPRTDEETGAVLFP